MRTLIATTFAVLLAFATGCNQNRNETADAGTQPPAAEQATQQNLTPEQLGELGAKIRESPERANELLSEHGLDEKSFESEIRKVTEDPDASKRYAEAYRKASA